MNEQHGDKSIRVASAKPDTMSRRDFLKGGAAGIITIMTLSDFLTACANNPKENVTFVNFGEGATVQLKITGEGNNPQQIVIRYADPSSDTKLAVRQTEGEFKNMNFQSGASTVRLVGELLSDTLVPVTKSPLVKNNITVGLYPSAGPARYSLGHKELPTDEEVWAIPVITANEDWMVDGRQPLEINSRPPSDGVGNLTTFGYGFAVGQLQTIGGQRIFTVLGYVHDGRVLTERTDVPNK